MTPGAVALLRRMLRGERRAVALALVTGLGAELALVAGPAAMQRAIDDGVRDENVAALVGWLGIMLVVGTSAAALTRVRQSANWRAGARAVSRVRVEVGVAVRDPRRVPHVPEPGELYSRVQRDGDSLWEWMSGVAETVILFVVAVVVVGAILAVDPVLAAVAVVAAAFVALAAVAFPARAERRSATSSAAHARTTALTEDMLTGVETIRGMGGDEALRARFDDANAAARRAEQSLARVDAAWTTASRAPLLLGVAVGLGVGGAALAAGRVEVGGLLAFTAWMSMLADLSAGLVRQLLARRSGRAAATRVSELLAAARDTASATALVDLEPGAVLHVTGRTGSGKTGLLRAWAGDGGRTPLRIGERTPRTQFVGSVPALVSGSVRENITLGWDGDADAVVASARIAGVHDEITALEAGYDTVVGEGGAGLSGGQRQRIAVARAVLRRPDVLLLDEVTDAVEEKTGVALLERLHALEGRPALVIASSRALPIPVTSIVALSRS